MVMIDERTLKERTKPFRCGECNVRIIDVNYDLPTEAHHKCEKCAEKGKQVFNTLRIIVVRD